MQFFVYALLALFSSFSSTNAAPSHRKRPHQVVAVDQSGHGHFRTIQAAIDSIPFHNQHWVYIRVTKGLYREQVSIPKEKPFIFLKGEGKSSTQVIWGAHLDIETSATFSSYADNIIVRDITFVNSYNTPQDATKNPQRPAVAAKIQGDKMAFHRCGFYGLQDTLWDVQGRHYFRKCTIQGSVDFIFGAGQSLYEKCTISVVENQHKVPGYITAQGRSRKRETNGFVFKECEIVGKGKTYLGRAWREFAKVLFYNTSMSEIVVPQGWSAWTGAGKENQLTFVEHQCHGKGSDTSRRVKWTKKLGNKELKQLASISFIDNEGWMRNQSFNIVGNFFEDLNY